VLAKANQATPCRYTSFLRVDTTDKLTSIWTYDRQHPAVDPFPLGLPVHASYAVLVREARATVAIEDTAADPRTTDLEQRLACYVGVPLFRENGSVLGTLCCYDDVPRALGDATRKAVAEAAMELEPLLREIFTSL
jgi:GAF domain-containing protein